MQCRRQAAREFAPDPLACDPYQRPHGVSMQQKLRFRALMAAAALTSTALMGGCGGGGASAAPAPAPTPGPMAGVATPSQVSVVTAK
jgi:hypothetical protein